MAPHRPNSPLRKLRGFLRSAGAVLVHKGGPFVFHDAVHQYGRPCGSSPPHSAQRPLRGRHARHAGNIMGYPLPATRYPLPAVAGGRSADAPLSPAAAG